MTRSSRLWVTALIAAPVLVAAGCKAGGGGGGGGGDGSPVAVTGVDLNKHELSLVAGGSERLVATVLPANATNKNVSWSIDVLTSVSVAQDGTVSSDPGFAGTALVTVTTDDGHFTATCSVTVAVVVPGTYRFVAAESAGLKIVDVRSPHDPHLEATVKTRGTAMAAFVSGNHAYVAESGAGLEIVDVTDPAAPVTVGACATQGWQYATAVWVDGNFAYIADDYMGLTVIDVTDRTHPVQAGSLDTAGAAVDVTVSNGRAYVADRTGGLAIVNVADPHHPVQLGTYGAHTGVTRVAVSGDRAYLTDSNAGLVVVNVADPASPSLVGTYDTPGAARDVFVSGDYAYVADDDRGLAIIDISDPADPALVGTLDTEGKAVGVTVTGDHAYVADAEGGLVVVDVGDRHHPSLAGVYNLTTYPQGIEWVEHGNYVYVADYLYGLRVVGWLDAVFRPGRVASLALSGQAWDVEYFGDRAYVAGGAAGLHVVNVVVPGTPSLVETVALSGADVSHVSVQDEKAYLSTGADGLYIRDLHDPALDRDIRGFEAWDLAVSGSHVFVVSDGEHSGDPHLVVVHTGADPTHTDYEFEESHLGRTEGAVLYGNFLYLAARNGIFAVNVENPDAPSVVGGPWAAGVLVSHLVADEHYLYLAGRPDGLVILNRSTGDIVGSAPTGSLLGIDVHGDWAYACGPDGLVVVDVSNPADPKVRFTEGRFMAVF